MGEFVGEAVEGLCSCPPPVTHVTTVVLRWLRISYALTELRLARVALGTSKLSQPGSPLLRHGPYRSATVDEARQRQTNHDQGGKLSKPLRVLTPPFWEMTLRGTADVYLQHGIAPGNSPQRRTDFNP